MSADPTPDSPSPRRAALWRYLRLAIGLILTLALIPTLLTPEFWTTLASVNVPLVILSLILSMLSVVTKAWRWGIVMRWRGINLSSGYLLTSYFVGMFFNNFLPSGMGGDAVRAIEVARHTGKGAESVTAVLIERGSGMLAVFASGSIFALFVPSLPLGIALLAHGLFLGALIGIWALWLDVTGRILARIGLLINSRLPARFGALWAKATSLYDEFRIYRHEWRLMAAVMWQSLLTLILTLASVYALLLAFDQPVSFAAFTAFFSIATALDTLPLSPNSIGIREGIYVFFLGLLGVPHAAALGVALMVRLVQIVEAGGGGIAFVWRNLRGEPEKLPDIQS